MEELSLVFLYDMNNSLSQTSIHNDLGMSTSRPQQGADTSWTTHYIILWQLSYA